MKYKKISQKKNELNFIFNENYVLKVCFITCDIS